MNKESIADLISLLGVGHTQNTILILQCSLAITDHEIIIIVNDIHGFLIGILYLDSWYTIIWSPVPYKYCVNGCQQVWYRLM